MRRNLAWLATLALVAAASSRAADDENPTVKDNILIRGEADPKFNRFDVLLTTYLDKYDQPGASVAVGKEGKVLFARGYGYADKEAKRAVEPSSLFRVSSVSKPITAVAVLQLVEQGKLDLDAKVMDVLALVPPARGFDDRWRKVTIRHLLEHRGGWDFQKSADPMFISPIVVREVGGTHPAMPAAIIKYMLRQKLDFEPGERFAYCNFGYCLLGRVIEKLTRTGYETHVKKAVLAPLGIKDMRLGKTLWAQRATGEVRYYSGRKVPAVMGKSLGKSVPLPYGGYCLEAMDSCAGWLGTATDALKFTNAFDDPKACKILKPESVERMFARPDGEETKDTWHAMGWSVQIINKQRAYWQDGSIDGAGSMVFRRPDGVTFAVLLNSNDKVEKALPIAVLTRPMHLAVEYVFNRNRK